MRVTAIAGRRRASDAAEPAVGRYLADAGQAAANTKDAANADDARGRTTTGRYLADVGQAAANTMNADDAPTRTATGMTRAASR